MSTLILGGFLAGFVHSQHADPQGAQGIRAVVREGLARAWRHYLTRRDFAVLDERMLKDLGVSHAQAHFEANRPIWR